ncbi:hypothetical protein HN832_04705 [archaeon]|jgi:hypothetical protein|nr:hypothetical protein [archaeon]MBT4373989.1 hypothetical protein [archaeon]MBT4532085.1 hypothetical protein [archaeon]MBT7001975.1 hypothetical protein [archaeon]MBT7282686.1 hypothetical protein [archaeon]
MKKKKSLTRCMRYSSIPDYDILKPEVAESLFLIYDYFFEHQERFVPLGVLQENVQLDDRALERAIDYLTSHQVIEEDCYTGYKLRKPQGTYALQRVARRINSKRASESDNRRF